MKAAVIAVALMASFGAHATGSVFGGDTTNNYDQRNYGGNTTNAPVANGGAGGAGGRGGDGGNGYGGNAIAGASSAAEAKANAAAIAAQQQGQAQGQGQSQSARSNQSQSNTGTNTQGQTANGGSSVSAGGNASAQGGQGSGNATSVTFEGSTYKEAAQTAYAPSVYVQPVINCHLYIGLGGSSVNGSASGGIPIGQSNVCLRNVNKKEMADTNKVFPGTYTKEDFLAADCSVEGMDKMLACKKH